MSEATVKKNKDELNKKIDAIVNNKSPRLNDLSSFISRMKGKLSGKKVPIR